MAEVKISELPLANTLSISDRVVVLVNPANNASVRTITTTNFSNSFRLSNNAPASYTSNGVAGQIAYDSTFLYVCVANNTWGRVELDFVW
jgi:hypothetical protein